MGDLGLSSMCGGGGSCDGGSCSLLPSADSLLCRLDHVDERLRQLEEKQRLLPAGSGGGNSYFTADLGAALSGVNQQQQQPCCKPLSSALHEVHLKGTLMDRLRLLESRIRQLHFQLDRGSTSAPWMLLPKEIEQEIVNVDETAVMAEGETHCKGRNSNNNRNNNQGNGGLNLYSSMVVGAPRRSGELFRKGARRLHVDNSNAKAKETTRDAIIAAEKRASAMCRKEKKRMERTRIYKKWFPVGC